MAKSPIERLETALAILATFMKMSDEAEALGGAMSIAGIASLHKMQTSIQKNGPRLAALAATLYSEPLDEDGSALSAQSEGQP